MSFQDKVYETAVNELKSDTKRGLTTAEAERRLSINGMNKLDEKKAKPLIIRFLMQFNDFMVLILLAAGVMSIVVSIMTGENDFADPIIIFAIVCLNAVLGIIQESKAEKAIEALKKMSSPMAKIIRDGHVRQINSCEIVAGDIMLLEPGDMVPADGRLISSVNLKIEESALTGESVPVEKDFSVLAKADAPMGDRLNMVFSSTAVTYGKGTAVVTATGMKAEIGKIAALIMDDKDTETPLQKRLEQTGKVLGISALVICIIIFFIGLVRKIPPFEMFMTSVSLAVAAIPEGLPAIVTIMLAIGVQRMARHNAVIRKLPAVETLGSANVICSDKTGTLTQNKMKVVEVSNGKANLARNNAERKVILNLSALCNDCHVEYEEDKPSVIGDPTEAALIYAALDSEIDIGRLNMDYPRINEVPFDSKRKLMSTVHRNYNDGFLIVAKGAPDFLLERCLEYVEKGIKKPLTGEKKKEILAENSKMADRALRVLGVAYLEINKLPSEIKSETVEKNLVFAGLAAMIDPPREEAAEAVKTCLAAGIKPVMVTGDHVSTAIAIARKIGILQDGSKAMTGEELTKLTQKELESCIEKYSVFARVSPEHKMRIVNAFQARGNIVAMTGDGVNDAPALKTADIGCAMGISGTDVAKASADMVLTDDNFATIVEAVREGRGIYANIRKAVHFLLSSNIGEIITILAAIILGWETPLLAIHLLWVNLVTDSLPAIALGLDPAEEDVMKRKPYKNESSLFDGGLWQRIGLEGCMIGLLSLIAFGMGTILFDKPGSHTVGRTMAFAVLSISQLVHAFNMRSDGSIFKIDIFGNKYLVGAFLAGVVMQTAVIMIPPLAVIFKVVPLSPYCWFIVFILSMMPIVIVELEKFVVTKIAGKKPGSGKVLEKGRARGYTV